MSHKAKMRQLVRQIGKLLEVNTLRLDLIKLRKTVAELSDLIG